MSIINAEALAKIAATGLAGIFAGSATYISVVQHPALLETDEAAFQAPFFRNMFFYAARMQASLAFGSGVSTFVVSYLQRDHHSGADRMSRLWMSSGCLMVAIVPYTILKMRTLNAQLLDKKLCDSQGPKWVQKMLVRWGHLHHVRTGASLIAFTSMIVAITCSGDRQQHLH